MGTNRTEIEDNVIDLPTSRSESAPAPAAEASQEAREEKSQEVMLNLVDKQRQEGIALVNRKLELLSETRETLGDPKAEHVTRSLEQGLGGVAQATQALSTLLDVIIHDVGISVQNLHRHAHGLEQISTHLQAVMNLALERGLFTDDELREEVRKVLSPAPRQEPIKEQELTTEEV